MTNQSWGWDKTISTAARLTSKNITVHAHKSVWELEWLKPCFGYKSSSKEDSLLVKNKMFNLCGSLFWERFDFDCCRHCSLSNWAGESGNSPKGAHWGLQEFHWRFSRVSEPKCFHHSLSSLGASAPSWLQCSWDPMPQTGQQSTALPLWVRLGGSKHPHSYISELIPGSKLYSRRTLKKRSPSNNP